tara:strand:- start:648 stop:1277 length:630 start_codon:yes stop_codon:yes gene_type:complete
MKIIYCGFFKTASRSIGDFIDEVTGYNPYVGKSVDLHSHPTDVLLCPNIFQLKGDDMSSCIHDGEVEDKAVYDFLKEHDTMIARDYPYFGMYKHINENYKDAKFIICIRNTESFIKSYVNHFNGQLPLARNKGNNAVLGVYGPCKDEHIERLRTVYEAHNSRVLGYFKDKPEKLLVLDFEDIGTKNFEDDIVKFIGCENPKNVRMKHIK